MGTKIVNAAKLNEGAPLPAGSTTPTSVAPGQAPFLGTFEAPTPPAPGPPATMTINNPSNGDGVATMTVNNPGEQSGPTSALVQGAAGGFTAGLFAGLNTIINPGGSN